MRVSREEGRKKEEKKEAGEVKHEDIIKSRNDMHKQDFSSLYFTFAFEKTSNTL